MFVFGFLKTIIVGLMVCVIILGVSIFICWKIPKNDIINVYDTILQAVDEKGLSKDNELKGQREFGVDNYVGKYTAQYNNDSKEETIFGGTALHRTNREYINLSIKITKISGNIEIIERLGTNEITLLNDAGEYNNNVYIDGVSYYLTIKLDNFSGNIEMVAE